ncbi:MAG: hypothetical protein ABFC96_12255 [Thermoguttaceae bacterium]
MDCILNEQRICYDQLSERAEGWKSDHHKAMACRDVEQAVAIGLAILKNIRRWHETSAREVEQGATDFSWDSFEAVCGAYRWWLERSTVLLDVIAACEAGNFNVDGADDFRNEVRDISLMSLNVGQDRQAIASLEADKGIPSGKAMDEVRDRLRRSRS